MNCRTATESYEAWLAQRTAVVQADLDHKHQQMSADIFSFMRATYYRWLALWSTSSEGLRKAPVVLAVGDLHVENFGTWRDSEGRLVWGINDFDEAFELPFTNDLARLAVSAHLAIAADELAITPTDACAAILKGYKKALDTDGVPFVLAENHNWLRNLAMSDLRDPVKFWDKLKKLSQVEAGDKARKLLLKALPERKLPYRIVHRVAGLGSLGKERFLALAEWNGGLVAREAKARVPSTSVWFGAKPDKNDQYEQIIARAVRASDHSLELHKHWVLRRLAPDASRIELKDLPREKDVRKLLEAMGRESANIHLGSSHSIKKIRRDLESRPRNWLHDAAKTMVEAITADWQEWCSGDSETAATVGS